MGYPNGPLLRVLAERVLANLDYIDKAAPQWDPKSDDRDRAPFTDTQLLISTLGFLVFPHERTPDALGGLLQEYDKEFKLSDVMTIIHPVGQVGSIEIEDENGEPIKIDPGTIQSLPRLLRNSIAHFNVRPIETDGGRFGGVRVWNTDPDGNITLIADIKFDQLRRLARFVLNAFSGGRNELKNLDDPPDPLEFLKKLHQQKAKPKMPKLNRDHWDAALAMHGGDPAKAKTWLDQTISAGLRRR
jgi:hypothetical protein